MVSVCESKESLTRELFTPELNDNYRIAFCKLLETISNTLPSNREEVLTDEILNVKKRCADNQDIETLKYLAMLNVLIDLSRQGWVFEIAEKKLYLRRDNDDTDSKEKIRYRLRSERNAQFKNKSVQDFIRKMETPRKNKDNCLSIKNLIGDKAILQERIRNNKDVCSPYLQLVTNNRDSISGFRLADIWRYFRYTWSIPYKTMPGRNLYYLVRDSSQLNHPVIGIFALGNSVLNLAVRDNYIGWTVDAIKTRMDRRVNTCRFEQTVGETNGNSVKVKQCFPLETEKEHIERTTQYSSAIYPLLTAYLDRAIKEIYVKDLDYHRQTKYPKTEMVDRLLEISAESNKKAINNHNKTNNPNWEEESLTPLFKRKRAAELSKLLSAKMVFQKTTGNSNYEKLKELLSSEEGCRAINTALIANRKCKIGSNMMEIIVCGAIPPYNELLGGKLVSILACSPTVIRDYTKRYERQISEIASRMKGEKVVRDSHLVFLGTTSLYYTGSSQYNRIKVPIDNDFSLEYKKMGITEGYGTVYFSSETTFLFSKILEITDGGKRINHVFGEGTSPRFRLISRGLSTIGFRADLFLRHYTPRIVYSIDLAKNAKAFLNGFSNTIDYGFDIDNKEQVAQKTQQLIDYWYTRWLQKRLTTVNIIDRLEQFDVDSVVLSNLF